MKANEIKLSKFLSQSQTQFVIPVYQRNYDWKKQQCRQLLDDIIDVGKDNKRYAHFIGSIVYIHDDVYSSSDINELTIIDGQQRITTITLVYAAIHALAQESNDEKLEMKINQTYLINQFADDDEEKLKLKPTENNEKALRYIIKNEKDLVSLEYSRLVENFEYLKSRIKNADLEVIQAGLNKLIFVEVSLERGKDDPQRIFESLNSTGLDLSQADLIRNYILMGLKKQKQNRIYKEFWEVIEEKTTDQKTKLNRVSDFIRDFLTIEKREIPNKNKIYDEFKKRYPIENFSQIEETLPKIKQLACFYNKIINPDCEPDLEIREQIKFINRLEINVSYPFLMEVYNDYENKTINKREFVEILEIIQSYVWRRFIVGLPTNALNKIFLGLYKDIDPSNYITSLQASLLHRKGSQRFPNNEEVLEMLKKKDVYNIQNKNRLYFLERLENHNNQERVLVEGSLNITIEHIFPQNPDGLWKMELGIEQFNYFKDNLLNTIANLTLSGNNGALGNQSFLNKRDMNTNGKEQGYRFSRLWLNKYLASIEKWDLVSYEERFKLLSERFKSVWKYPKNAIDANRNYQEVNIFDAGDPTFKKLEYGILFEHKLNVKTVTDLYVEVIKYFLELNSDAFLKTDLAEKIVLHKEKDFLRQATPVSESYFLETNIDNNTKFERIKLVLSSLNAEEDLFIKYSD